MKKLLLTLAVMFGLFGFVVTPTLLAASPAEEACAGIEAAGGTCDAGGADGAAGNLIQTIIKVLSWVVGAVSVIMIIIGGFRYVISGGDSSGVSGAKNTILYAIIGLLVVIFAQVIVSFVWSEATKPADGSAESSETSQDTSTELDTAPPATDEVIPVEPTE